MDVLFDLIFSEAAPIVIFFLIVLPGLVFWLLTRVNKLEEQVRKMEKAPREEKVVEKAPVLARERAVEERESLPIAERAREEEVRPALPPPLPPKVASVPAVAKAVEQSPPPVEATPESVAAEPNPIFEWLGKVGLMPPRVGEEGTNLIAWWSTRAGLVLGVIAAVFFGMYVNQNTVPLVRLLELGAVAVGLFAGGWCMEKKLGAFGRALSAGGLALFYVTAFAAYGLEAMKVIEDPLTGALVQVLAVVLMGGWALWRRNEGIFGLALALGYVTGLFAWSEGIEPLPLISFLVLAAGGSSLFALRGWWSGFLGALVGSSGGVMLLAVFRWRGEAGPTDLVGLGAACLLTVILVAGLYARSFRGESLVNRMLPFVTSVGVVVGAVVTWALGIEWEYYYATFAVLLLLVGWLWRRGEGKDTMWEVMWAKASVFIALFLIAKFDGPVRAYGLLAQAGSLAYLARRKDWLVFDLGALLAMATGWVYVQRELSPDGVTSWVSGEMVVLGFLFGALGLLAYFGRGERFAKGREILVTGVVALLAAGVVWVSVLRVDHDWALLAGLIGAVVFLGVGRVAKFWKYELLAVVFLAPTFVWLVGRGISWSGGRLEVEGVSWQILVWLGATWGYCAWLGLQRVFVNRVVSMGLMLVSIVAVGMAGSEFFGSEWIPVVLLGLAVLWQLGEKRVPIRDLSSQAAVAAVFGGLFTFGNWGGELKTGVLLSVVVLALGNWALGWLGRRKDVESGAVTGRELLRGFVLGLVLLTVLTVRLEGAGLVMGFAGLSSVLIGGWLKLRDQSLVLVAVVSALFSMVTLLDGEASESWPVIFVAVVFVLFVLNGLLLARSGRPDALAMPRVASVGWGALAMVSVLVGMTLDGQVAGWTTAFWAVGAVALLAAGFWGGLRGYRVIGLLGIGCAILRLFSVDVQETFWRIVAFGVTGGLLVGIGYVYSRFHRRLAAGDLDWGREEG